VGGNLERGRLSKKKEERPSAIGSREGVEQWGTHQCWLVAGYSEEGAKGVPRGERTKVTERAGRTLAQ